MSDITARTTDNDSRPRGFVSGFRELFYTLRPSADIFDVDSFRNSLVSPLVRERDVSIVAVAPRDATHGLYHVAFGWNLKLLEFAIWYYNGPKKHESDEHEPFAEDFMSWFSTSFRKPTVEAHVHARFKFPHEARVSKFPLPQQSGEAEVYGIRLRLPSKPRGVDRVGLSKGKSAWLVEAIADRSLTFANFTPFDDANEIASVVDATLWTAGSHDDIH